MSFICYLCLTYCLLFMESERIEPRVSPTKPAQEAHRRSIKEIMVLKRTGVTKVHVRKPASRARLMDSLNTGMIRPRRPSGLRTKLQVNRTVSEERR